MCIWSLWIVLQSENIIGGTDTTKNWRHQNIIFRSSLLPIYTHILFQWLIYTTEHYPSFILVQKLWSKNQLYMFYSEFCEIMIKNLKFVTFRNLAKKPWKSNIGCRYQIFCYYSLFSTFSLIFLYKNCFVFEKIMIEHFPFQN